MGRDEEAEVAGWAASGAMAITGRDGAPPLGPPAGLVPKLRRIEAQLVSSITVLGGAVAVDALALLGERAALTGLGRQGATSCGGATRLLQADDGWIAVTLARPDDLDLVAAWLELSAPPDDVWQAITSAAARSSASHLVERGAWLGLPIARLPPVAPIPFSGEGLPVRARQLGDSPPVGPLTDVVVVDLTSLWAGPLCGSLMAGAGARVVKVESISRPDGARRGPPAFFDLLNADKQVVTVDLRRLDGARTLAELVASADVVIEASRPRALEQLGVHAEAALRGGRTRVWTSITGHGRQGPGRDRVAFGDDAAVAGGLVSWDADGPCFCADAVADPTAGIVAATATLDALRQGGRWLVDVPMAGVAAHLAGPTLAVPEGISVAPPRARQRANPSGPSW